MKIKDFISDSEKFNALLSRYGYSSLAKMSPEIRKRFMKEIAYLCQNNIDPRGSYVLPVEIMYE